MASPAHQVDPTTLAKYRGLGLVVPPDVAPTRCRRPGHARHPAATDDKAEGQFEASPPPAPHPGANPARRRDESGADLARPHGPAQATRLDRRTFRLL